MVSLQLEVSKAGRVSWRQLRSRGAGEGGGKPQLQQSSKAFLNWAAFERNGRSGEAGRGRGIIRGKPHSALPG